MSASSRMVRQGNLNRTEVMEKEKQGVWAYRTKEMLHGVYYDFELVIEGEAIWSADPYAKACGINGQRSMIVDLKQTDPDGWQEEVSPEMQPEQVIYEVHIGGIFLGSVGRISRGLPWKV